MILKMLKSNLELWYARWTEQSYQTSVKEKNVIELVMLSMVMCKVACLISQYPMAGH